MATDRELVNFSEDHELNHCLRSAGKRQTKANREALVGLGRQVKDQLGKRVLTHDEVSDAIKGNDTLFE
ncbi:MULTISPECIES: hypothetical protein [Vibrio]|uniref:Uncharacterized protein n=1 Tax=Vibrio proteolyticus NBRC 13287 TaxID=1219065 RepID=U2ZY57_VIBPR|nr:MULTISPECIES: hypothetical protein [Vibrio]NAW59365.1 hypothetical protein [Vibrio sp. V36_P2S2PM302]NAX20294.1 hypothetical protein [Vibrio sp. V39_P1S14PM300]NAX24908.1 hypothetical protein [Vibrio sp. V38_P2S17PM301]NAX29464.1 hypothetical protein [Vibrio sp. V37_P2S8PM304]GAD66345.1 hypothetical protein VPR01S_03_02550 [Vibrio proteolyticus NBRC 13287]